MNSLITRRAHCHFGISQRLDSTKNNLRSIYSGTLNVLFLTILQGRLQYRILIMDDSPLDLNSIAPDEEKRLLEELQHRSRPVGPHAKSFKAVVKNWKIRRNLNSQRTTEMTELQWSSTVGETLAAYTRPGQIRRGALEIYVDSPLVLQELTMRKPQILQSLQESLPDHGIRTLRFKSQF